MWDNADLYAVKSLSFNSGYHENLSDAIVKFLEAKLMDQWETARIYSYKKNQDAPPMEYRQNILLILYLQYYHPQAHNTMISLLNALKKPVVVWAKEGF